VVVKLGGMLNRLAAYDYRALPAPVSSTELAGYWHPYMETCIERFGASTAEKLALFSGTARRVYRLD
jgi:L-fuconolactonase